MNIVEFHQLVEKTWLKIEEQLEEQHCDVDCEIHGSVMTIFFHNDSQIVINKQESKNELWLASKLGGFHFKYQDNDWVDRQGHSFWERLEEAVIAYGESVSFN